MTLCVIHPDKNLREALARTLEHVWEQPVETAEEKPSKPLEAVVYIAPKGTELPENCLVVLEGQRLKNLVAAAQAKHRALTSPRRLDFGAATLDTVTRDFTADGKTASLTEKEAAILVYLFQRKTAATREDLWRDVWQYASDADTHTIETHIYRLRQKIEIDPENPRILLTGKEGYRLAAASNA